MPKNIYVYLEYSESGDYWKNKYGPYTKSEAQEMTETLKTEFGYAISQGCAEISYKVNGKFAWDI